MPAATCLPAYHLPASLFCLSLRLMPLPRRPACPEATYTLHTYTLSLPGACLVPLRGFGTRWCLCVWAHATACYVLRRAGTRRSCLGAQLYGGKT